MFYSFLETKRLRIKLESKEAKTRQEAVRTLCKFMASTTEGYPELSEVIQKIPVDFSVFWIICYGHTLLLNQTELLFLLNSNRFF